MLITLDPTSSTPLYAQLVAALRRTIVDGEVPPGEKLPSAGELATALELNRNTVLRAYRELRDEGLVELRRGRGATIITPPRQTSRVEEALDALAEAAGSAGVPLSNLTAGLSVRGIR